MKVRYSKRAVQQIDRTLGFIAERSPSGAAKVERRIAATLSLLRLQPYLGRRTAIPAVRRIVLIPYP